MREGCFSHPHRRKEAPEEQCTEDGGGSWSLDFISVERQGQPLARRPGQAQLGSIRGERWRMECQGRSLELGPGKDGAQHMENLPGHPKGPVGAGDHEAVGIQVHMVVSFSPTATWQR